jgi:hypothetical protein
MYTLYTDDSILVGPTNEELDECIEAIKQAGLRITVDGDITDFLGVKVKQNDNGTIMLTQPHLIDQI